MSRQANNRAHLGLQVTLLAEQRDDNDAASPTKTCEHFGVEIGSVKDGVQRWVHDTDVRRVVEKLEAELLED